MYVYMCTDTYIHVCVCFFHSLAMNNTYRVNTTQGLVMVVDNFIDFAL